MSKRVVYVEDCEHDQMLATRIFNNFNPSPNVTMLNDGEKAVAFLKSLHEVPDLVFVDIQLVLLNGIEVIRELKKLARYKYVPFVIMSGVLSRQFITDAYEAGAVSVLTKHDSMAPLDWTDQMNATLYYWLQVARSPSEIQHMRF